MHHVVDLDRYPLDKADSPAWRELVAQCRAGLQEHGLFDLEQFVRPEPLAECVAQLAPRVETQAFTHRRKHNIYFLDEIAGLPADHPALQRFETVNHTLCGDQLTDTILRRIYEWPRLTEFLAAVMERPNLHVMADRLADANVMTYRPGEALNWHFDRSEFTTTLLLQPAERGGRFQYCSDLRSEADPAYDQVGRFLDDPHSFSRIVDPGPGTLTVFKGKYAAHRVTPVEGGHPRMIAVFSYYDRPGVRFTDAERIGFYGRASSLEAAS